MERLQGKVALFLRVLRRELVQHGLVVVGLARKVDKMQNEMKDVKGSGKFQPEKCDMSIANDVMASVSLIQRSFRAVHLVINIFDSKKENPPVTADVEPDAEADAEANAAADAALEGEMKKEIFGLLEFNKQLVTVIKENKNDAQIVNVNSVAGHKVGTEPTDSFSLKAHPISLISKTLTKLIKGSKIRLREMNMGAGGDAESKPLEDLPVSQAEDAARSIIAAMCAPPCVNANAVSV